MEFDNMNNDDLLKQGIDFLKQFQLKDAESCFLKVLDNDGDNETAKKGMMLQSLYTGFEEFEGPIVNLLNNQDQYDPDEYVLKISELSSNLVKSTERACSYYNDIVFLYDLIAMRGVFYESRFKGTRNIDYCNLAGLYFSFTCSWHTGAQDVDADTLAELERARDRAGFFLDCNERMKTGEYKRPWEEVLDDENLFCRGLLRKEDDGKYTYFVPVARERSTPVIREFGVLQSIGQAMTARI